MRRLSILTAAAALATTSPAFALNIDTTGTDVGTIFNYGYDNTATYGQTFMVEAGATSITDFSLFLRDRYTGSGTLDLRGYLATWDGTNAVNLLYSSPTATMNADGTLQEFSFNTASLAVNPGDWLVAFLSISELGTQDINQFGMPYAGDVIAGQFVFMNNGQDFGALFTDDWTAGWVGEQDAWLTVNFASGVPEPSTWAMMLLGFGAAGFAMRRRKVVMRAQPA